MEEINMWSWHWICGCHFGFEWYQDMKMDDSKNKRYFEFFIIDVGCLRIQKCEQVENV
jgi:hypothetical protein